MATTLTPLAPKTETAPVLVLAVDDVADNLDVLEALLEGLNVRMLRASSGTQALELLLEHDVALALIDVQMPEMNGFELAEFMRGTERTRRVPIIFVTASSPEYGRIFRGYEAGAVDFLFKPIDPHLLESKVEVFIELFRQRQQLAAQVEEHRALLKTSELLIGVLGHDLRNPLNVILTAGETLRLAHPDDEKTLHIADRIRSSSLRMTRLITHLLDFAAARLGTLPIKARATDLSAVAGAAIAEFEHSAASFTSEVRGDLNGTWDPDRIAQILSNLLGNAVQHGDLSEPITLRVDGGAADSVRIEIENRGEIPEAVRESLFAPFVRSGSTSTGAGLGLFIVDQIAKAHGGGATAATRDGRTIFTVQLARHHPAPAE